MPANCILLTGCLHLHGSLLPLKYPMPVVCFAAIRFYILEKPCGMACAVSIPARIEWIEAASHGLLSRRHVVEDMDAARRRIYLGDQSVFHGFLSDPAGLVLALQGGNAYK